MPESKSTFLGFSQVAATLFLGVVGLIFTGVMNLQQEQNRKTQLAVQLLSQREQSETDFRQKIFETLVNRLLDPKIDVQTRATTLELFQHNFHDIFNGRALFDVLEQQASDQGQKEVVRHLVSLAKQVTENQESLVAARRCPASLRQGERAVIELPPIRGRNFHADERAEPHTFTLEVLETHENDVKVKATIDGNEVNNGEPFQVSYFDAPFTDNILLPDHHRFAVRLKNVEHELSQVKLNVFEFPADYVTTGYRPSIDEANNMLEHLPRKGDLFHALWCGFGGCVEPQEPVGLEVCTVKYEPPRAALQRR